MVKYHSPRRGSLGFRRKRARRMYPRIYTWPKVDEVRLLGFPAYKVGMISVHERNILVHKRAMWYGIERTIAATILEAPPIRILGIRGYKADLDGLRSVIEVWTPYYSKFERKYLQRKLQLPKKNIEELSEAVEDRLKKMNDMVDSGYLREIRVIVRTSPELTTIGKKKPELLEIGIGGETREALKWAANNLGKFVRATDVVESGMFVDVIGVTKGKGFQGVARRFGIKLLPRKSKKGYRRLGSLGPWTPGRIMWTVPRPGQLGVFRRTEYNKQVMLVVPSVYSIEYKFDGSEDEPYMVQLREKMTVKTTDESGEEKQVSVSNLAEDLNPRGGWPHYGVVRNDTIVIRGSCMGTPKRMVVLRRPVRTRVLKKEVELKAFYYGKEKVLDSDKIGLIFKAIEV
ncbi:MAG: 50S ribosomal protein L3 [Candidatus Njordarchaeota archaeon]